MVFPHTNSPKKNAPVARSVSAFVKNTIARDGYVECLLYFFHYHLYFFAVSVFYFFNNHFATFFAIGIF